MTEAKGVKLYTRHELHKELQRLMPGFRWVVHRSDIDILNATGRLSSGFNRIYTIEVKHNAFGTTVYLYGNGTRGDMIEEGWGFTAARAFRDLRERCGRQSRLYKNAEDTLQACRKVASDA